MNLNRTYTELMTFDTFEERFEYLKLSGLVGEETFGYDRYLNQNFYTLNPDWKSVRNKVIIRDCGCDLAIPGREIGDIFINGKLIKGKVIIHHMNPVTKEDLMTSNSDLWNPEYLICTSLNTHNAIHYGNESNLIKDPVTRSKNDTCLWTKEKL